MNWPFNNKRKRVKTYKDLANTKGIYVRERSLIGYGMLDFVEDNLEGVNSH